MGRIRTGTIETFTRKDGSTYRRAKIRLADGSRVRVDIPAKYDGSDVDRRLYAAVRQEREDEHGDLLAAKRKRLRTEEAERSTLSGETCTEYRERLETYRVEMGKRSVRHEHSSWKVWIDPHVGKTPIAAVKREDIEAIRDALDEAIALHKRTAGAEGISGKHALNVWSTLTTTFKAAMQSKRRDLRVRDDNPCIGVLPPEKGESRRRTFIYPSELLAVLSQEGEAIPLAWRELYAIAAYLYLRPGELRALTWGDVDLDAGIVHVTKAWDEDASEVKSPKTRNGVRDVPIHPNLAPLLRRMLADVSKRHGGDMEKVRAELVAPVMLERHEDARARRIREHLRAAGCNRPRLYENTATTMHLNFRSLRDSGITWLALAGVDVVRMQRRAGHDNIATTMGYVKQAEDLSGTIGGPFPPLPPSLIGDATHRIAESDEAAKSDAVEGERSIQRSTRRRRARRALFFRSKLVARGGIEPPTFGL